MEKIVFVASTNPVKFNAVKYDFQKLMPNDVFHWHQAMVASGVSNQPSSDAETLLGAMNRVEAVSQQFPNNDFWVGVEGGIDFDENDEMRAFAWVVIKSGDQIGKARSGSFYLPPAIKKIVKTGKELGEADDIVFGEENSKQKSGAIGLLTNNIIDRSGLYEHAVILAFVPFLNPNLYF